MKKIVNARLVMLDRVLDGLELSYDGGKIVEISESISGCNGVYDAHGCYLAPGFIDRHVHGGWGFDFEAVQSVEEVHDGANEMAQFGCTALVPTTNTPFVPSEDDLRVLDVLEKAVVSPGDGVEVLGIHVEGAFLTSMAINPEFVLTQECYLPLLERIPHVLVWTVDPECEGALRFVAELTTRGIISSIGHTERCTYERFRKCVERGATHATHIYSGMNGFQRVDGVRRPGAIEASLMCPDVTVEVLSDRCHVSDELVRYVYQIKGPEKMILATDCHAMPFAYELGTPKVELIYLESQSRYAWRGSPGMSDVVYGAYKGASIPIHEVVRMASTNVARALGVGSRKGLLCEGFDADLVVFDDEVRIQRTICRGTTVYDAG